MRRPPNLPFLAGPPDFMVGLHPIPLESWLFPDWEAACLPAKRALLNSRSEQVCAALEGAQEAALEAGALMAGEASLEAAAACVSDDPVILQKRDGEWRATAMVLCAPTFFSAQEAIGKSLGALHGPVPDVLGPNETQGLAQRVARIFDALAPDTVLERFNWTVQPGPERYTPQAQPVFERAAKLGAESAADLLHLRVERQTIRKLPTSQAVLFCIRVSIDPLRDALAQPGARALFAQAWESAPLRVRQYKRWPMLDPAMAVLLQRLEES